MRPKRIVYKFIKYALKMRISTLKLSDATKLTIQQDFI